MMAALDLDRPNAARIYDFLLGGSHNFAVDRAAARQLAALYPQVAAVARANRSFLRRVVGRLVAEGVDQFLDLGSGIPTAGNVHEIAQRANPHARVAYVDNDLVAVAHSRTMLADNPNARVFNADLRRPERVLDEAKAFLDFGRPIGLLLVAVLHFVCDAAEAAEVLSSYRDVLAAGSYLVISHATRDGVRPELRTAAESARALYDTSTTPVVLRSRDEISDLLAGLDLVEPGIVPVDRWRPDRTDERRGPPIPVLAGLGRVRAAASPPVHVDALQEHT